MTAAHRKNARDQTAHAIRALGATLCGLDFARSECVKANDNKRLRKIDSAMITIDNAVEALKEVIK